MYAKYFKRILDFIFAIVLFIITLPILLVVGMLVGIYLGFPIIFKTIFLVVTRKGVSSSNSKTTEKFNGNKTSTDEK